MGNPSACLRHSSARAQQLALPSELELPRKLQLWQAPASSVARLLSQTCHTTTVRWSPPSPARSWSSTTRTTTTDCSAAIDQLPRRWTHQSYFVLGESRSKQEWRWWWAKWSFEDRYRIQLR